MFNPHTKFEVSTITCYEVQIWKATQNVEIVAVLGCLGVTQGHRQCRHSIVHIRLPNWLTETMHLSSTVFELGYGELFIELLILSYPHLHLALSLVMTSFAFCRDLRYQKTRVPGLSCGVLCVILHLAVLVEHWHVTETDSDTRLRHIPR